MQIASAVLVLAAVFTRPTDTRAAEDAAPAAFVSLKFEGTCDENNNRLWLVNTHTFKTIVTTIRWRAAGGKAITDDFYPSPNSVREIGCAAEGEILGAKFAEF